MSFGAENVQDFFVFLLNLDSNSKSPGRGGMYEGRTDSDSIWRQAHGSGGRGVRVPAHPVQSSPV